MCLSVVGLGGLQAINPINAEALQRRALAIFLVPSVGGRVEQ